MENTNGVATVQPILDRLAEFESTGMPVISLYLDTSPDQNGRDRFEAFLRKELRTRGRSFPLRSPERDSYDRDCERITAYVNDELQPSTNGLALFACAGANDFFEVTQLDARMTGHQLYVSDRPHLYPLIRLADQTPRYAVLVADTNAARLFVVGRGTTLRTEHVQNIKMTRSSVGGWSQMRYQRHIDNYHLHHAKDLVAALDKAVREDGIDQIVLAGDEVIIPVLRAQLPSRLSEMVVEILRLDITTPEHEVLKATAEALRQHDAQTDKQDVERMLDQFRAGQLAVVGARQTLAAFELGQVDTLVISGVPELVKDDRPEDDRPADDPSVGGDSAAVGEDTPLAELLVRKAHETSANVRIIEDPALLEEAGGVGAMLRFRV